MLKQEREKHYGEVLSLMLKDAQEAKNETYDEVATLREQKKIAESELKSLNKAVDKNYRGFLSVIKALLKMLYQKPEDPVELEQALHPVNSYLYALKAIPKAEENLSIIEEQLENAQRADEQAQNAVSLILCLQAKYPNEDKKDE